MITKTRFYKPVEAVLTADETAFLENGLSKKDKPQFDFKFKMEQKPIKTGRIARAGKTAYMDYQITYNFPSAIRSNVFTNIHPKARTAMIEYGQKGWSFRLLYEFLCESFNSGKPFIDTYFNEVFHTRSVYFDWMNLYGEICEQIRDEAPLKRDGTPDKKYSVFKKKIVFDQCQRIADRIRKDIEACLSTSIIPLSGKSGNKVAKNTRLIRSRIGEMKNLYSLFYASGQLIRSLNIIVEVSDKEARAV